MIAMTWTQILTIVGCFWLGLVIIAVWANHRFRDRTEPEPTFGGHNPAMQWVDEDVASELSVTGLGPVPDDPWPMQAEVRASVAGRPGTHKIELAYEWAFEPVASENDRIPAKLRSFGLLLYLDNSWTLLPWHTVQWIEGDINWDYVGCEVVNR